MKIATEAADKIAKNLSDFTSAVELAANSMPLSQSWISYYLDISDENPAKPLLIGAKISLFEACTAWALGSNRGAAASLRAYIENVCAWKYYKDHPIEFALVSSHEEDLMLPKAIKTYLAKIDRGFDSSYATLYKYSDRSEEYFYSTVSGFIHAHPSHIKSAKDIVSASISNPRDNKFLSVCKFSDEFISDIYLSSGRNHWDTMPSPVQDNAKSRLKDKLAKFISG